MYLDRDGNVIRGAEHQGLSRRRRARQRGRVRAGARQVRHDEARGRHRAGHPPRAARLRAGAGRRRPAGRRRRRIFAPTRRRPRSSSTRASRSRPDSASCRRTSRARCGASRSNGADGFYKGPIADAIVAASTRGKGIITKADLEQYKARELRADRVRLSRLSHRVGAAAELGRRDRLRNPGHPRRLSAARAGLPLRAGRALPDRGDAPRVRGSQQLSRRPRFRAQPDRAPAGQGLRRADPRRDRPGQGGRLARPSSPASRRTKGPTPRTTRSSTRTATPWRSPTR